jgi:hypothetical protein
MAARRGTRTKADREREYRDREQKVWDEFVPQLAALQTYDDAVELAARTPRPDAPGRRYYSNLSFFLGQFTVPMGSNGTERSLYAAFIRRLDAAGALKPGNTDRILAALASPGAFVVL